MALMKMLLLLLRGIDKIKKKYKRIESTPTNRLTHADYSWTLSHYRHTWRVLAVPFRAWTRTPLIKRPRAQCTAAHTLCRRLA